MTVPQSGPYLPISTRFAIPGGRVFPLAGQAWEPTVISDYAAVAIFLLVGTGFVLFTLLLSKIVRPSAPNPIKQSTYECGEEPFGTGWIQFNVRFYIFALMFVIFDVETVFLFPWAVAYQSLGLFALIEMLVFIAILMIGLVYAWRKGMLKWY